MDDSTWDWVNKGNNEARIEKRISQVVASSLRVREPMMTGHMLDYFFCFVVALAYYL